MRRYERYLELKIPLSMRSDPTVWRRWGSKDNITCQSPTIKAWAENCEMLEAIHPTPTYTSINGLPA